jgi:hypothetical protein
MYVLKWSSNARECQLELFNKMVKPILLYYYMVQKYGVLVKIFNVLKKYNLDFAHEI